MYVAQVHPVEQYIAHPQLESIEVLFERSVCVLFVPVERRSSKKKSVTAEGVISISGCGSAAIRTSCKPCIFITFFSTTKNIIGWSEDS
jgi:hypothetical protein